VRVDFSNVLKQRVENGLTREGITEAAKDVEVPDDVARLPHRTEASEIEDAGERLCEEFDAFVNIGIGGSALGGATLVEALAPGASVSFVDNIDPEYLTRLLDTHELEDTVFSIVSKSGRTAETIANYSVVCEALFDAGVEPSDNIVLTTGEDSPLAELEALEYFTFPDVPGRYSALSVVGLLPASFAGVDTEKALEGARGITNGADGSGEHTERWRALGATSYALGENGFDVSVMMPYSERLERFSEWYAQIWAESLGKDGYGQTPLRAVGATDQHSLLQLLLDGPSDKFVTLVDPGAEKGPTVTTPEYADADYLDGKTVGGLCDAEMDATQASLANNDVPLIRVELDGIRPREVGEFLQTYKLTTVVVAKMSGIDPFNQPGVEWGKRATRGILGHKSCADESSLVESYKETLLRL